MRVSSRVNHLMQRRGIYYWRCRVSADLHHIYQKQEVVLSLRADSLHRACILLNRLSSIFNKLKRDYRMKNTTGEQLERSLNRGYKQAYKVLSARAEGNYSDTVEDAMFRDLPVTELLEGQVTRGIKLTELHKLYEEERDVSKDTLTKHKSCLGLFIEIFGDVDVAFITKAI